MNEGMNAPVGQKASREMSIREKIEKKTKELMGQSKDCCELADCVEELLLPKQDVPGCKERPDNHTTASGWLGELCGMLNEINWTVVDTANILTRLREELKSRGKSNEGEEVEGHAFDARHDSRGDK